MKHLGPFGLVWLLAGLAWLAPVGQAAAAQAPDLEEEVHEIAAELRCPVCQNLSVADSPSGLAREMRDLIREQLQQGKTREEIRAYFVSKYGEWVLLTPKPSGFNLLVYLVPLLGGVAGVGGVLLAIRRWVRRRKATEGLTELGPVDRERLEQALEAEGEEPEGATVGGEGPVAELEAQRATLFAAIRELDFDHKAGMTSREDYEAARRHYEVEALGTMRRLDTLQAQAAGHRTAVAPGVVPSAASPQARGSGGAPAKAGPGRTRPRDGAEEEAARRARRPLWMAAGAVALVIFGAAVGTLLTLSIQPRPEGGSITGAPLTGTTPEMPPMASASTGDPARARQPLDPTTQARMLQAAHAALDAGRLYEATAAYRAILDRDPRNVEALTHMGNILERSGDLDGALHVYDKALEIDPRSPHTLWDKALLLFQRADYGGAIKAWQAFFDASPPGPDRDYVEQRMADARARLATSGPVPRPTPKAPASPAR